MKDYYAILGVSKNATEEEIKKAFRKLAHQHHPDKAGGNEAKFKEANEAYQVLSDKNKRAQYDRFGTAEPGFGVGGGGWPGGAGFGGFQGVDMGDLGDIFDSFFGGGGGFAGGGQSRRSPTRGRDIEAGIEVSLEDVFAGAAKNLSFETLVECETCKGKGGEPDSGFKDCSICNGKGQVREERRTILGSFMETRQCASCHGAGKIPNKVCHSCKGAGRKKGNRSLKIEILPGVKDGQVIHLKGQGEAGDRGVPAGDLYVGVRIKPHKYFERRGDDLIVRKEVSLLDLLRHKPIEVTTIAGEKKIVEVPGNHNLREMLRISGAGMPRLNSFGHGALLVELVVRTGKKPNGKVRDVLDGLAGEL